MARVLIVEDEIIQARIIQRDLERMDHRVVGIAGTAASALAKAAAERPDIILLDILLKGTQSGIDINRVINMTHTCHIIYMTALTDQTLIAQAKNTRHSGFLNKPFDSQDLKAVIDTVLDIPVNTKQ